MLTTKQHDKMMQLIDRVYAGYETYTETLESDGPFYDAMNKLCEYIEKCTEKEAE